jgi:hypothetical protein
MYLKPCRNCHKYKECDAYKAILKSLRGKRITSAQFICKEFTEFYKAGDRVTALLFERFEYYEDDNIDGTVVCIKESPRGKLTILLDELPVMGSYDTVTSRNKFITLWPKHVEPNGEPPVSVCGGCEIPIGRESESTYSYDCYECKTRLKRKQLNEI